MNFYQKTAIILNTTVCEWASESEREKSMEKKMHKTASSLEITHSVL